MARNVSFHIHFIPRHNRIILLLSLFFKIVVVVINTEILSNIAFPFCKNAKFNIVFHSKYKGLPNASFLTAIR